MKIENIIENQAEKPVERILESDISREAPDRGETEIIMQRHEKYIREDDNEKAGSLYEEAAKRAYEQTKEIFEKKLESLSPKEREDVAVMVVGSDTVYKGGGMRSIETAEEISQAIKDVMREKGMNESQFLNNSDRLQGDNVRPVPQFREPKMLENSPEFVKYLKDKYGDMTQEFWQAFEEDWEKEKREELGVEGPRELLERYSRYVEVLSRFARKYHHNNPDKRLIIWSVSHYDTISPYVKNNIMKTAPDDYLPVDFGAGISVKINKAGEKTCKLRGKDFVL